MLTSSQASALVSFWPIDDIIAVEPFHTDNYHNAGNTVFVQTTQGRYVLKQTKAENWPEWRYPMLSILHSHGVPVAVPIFTRAGEPYLYEGDAVFTLSPYLPGIAVSDHFAGRAEERARDYGTALARLHLGLRECESIAKPTEMNLLQDAAWAKRMINEAGCESQMQNITAVMREMTPHLESALESLPVQLIHRDAHAANLLYLDDKVTGWLDFDLAVRGPRLFDLCYCATSILMNGMDDPEKRWRWVGLLKSMVEGYTTVSPLNIAEYKALFSMLISIEVVFTGYYASQRDMEQMDRNIRAMLWIHKNKDSIQLIENDGL